MPKTRRSKFRQLNTRHAKLAHHKGGYNKPLEDFYKISIIILKQSIVSYDSGLWDTYNTAVDLYKQIVNDLMDKLRASNAFHRSVILQLVDNQFIEINNVLEREPKNLEWRNDVALKIATLESTLDAFEKMN